MVGAFACKDRAVSKSPSAKAVAPGAAGMEAQPVRRGSEIEPAERGELSREGPPDAVSCPVSDARNPDVALDAAATLYEEGKFKVALACTELAVDLIPQAVEAHHLRAAAQAALGQFAEAQTGFAMALALDPDDPETLAAAADFHINALTPKRRDTTLLGLEYARRGSDKAGSRRRRDRDLRARLALLEAQALNDLGRSDEALPRVDDALKLVPGSVSARYERGVSLFNVCDFDRAQTELEAVLEREPNDPYAHYHLGLIFERAGRSADARVHFDRARELAPGDFPQPVLLDRDEFRAEVDRALAALPDGIGRLLAGVAIEVADVPAVDDLLAVDPPFSPTILGLYRGLPAGVEDAAGTRGEVPSRAIVLYRNNLARAVRSRDELDQQIRRTLWHEIGHLEGFDEEELRRRGLE
jgi:Flp pilus assembly protein TadD